MRIWFWSQLIVAGALVAYGLVALTAVLAPQLIAFPIGNVIGIFGMPLFVVGLLVSLVTNQVLLANRPYRVVVRTERVLLGTEFALIVLSLGLLAVEEFFVEILIAWLLTIGLAIAACTYIALTSSRLRADVAPQAW